MTKNKIIAQTITVKNSQNKTLRVVKIKGKSISAEQPKTKKENGK